MEHITYHYSDVAHSADSLEEPAECFLVYPNPATNYLNFDIADKSARAYVKLYTAVGQCILKSELNRGRLDLPDLPNGSYFYSLLYNDTRVNGKVIIQK